MTHDGQEGATALEYAIMASLIAVVVIVAVVLLGQQASSSISCSADAVEEGKDYVGGAC